jgi:hypothetical protein
VDVLESFSQSYHQNQGAGYDPASWMVIDSSPVGMGVEVVATCMVNAG